MPRVVRERLVQPPPARMLALVDDPALMGGWFTFADRMEVLEGSGLGRLRRMYGPWGTQRSEIDQRIVVYDPSPRQAWRHEAERLDGKPAPRFAAVTVFTIELSPQLAGTIVRMTSAQPPADRSGGRRCESSELAKSLGKWIDR